MNRFYLFNTWILIFFIVLTALFFGASFFYILQLYLLNKKNKRFKKQNHSQIDEKKRIYGQNIKLAAKLDGNEKILASINKKDLQELTKKSKRNVDEAKTKNSPSCFEALFKIKKKKVLTESQHYALNEDGYFSESRNYYTDQVDGQAQSYESFETMTTDSECYRDWRHSIDFMSNGILNLNNQYNNHNNEIMQKAYEQLYAQQHESSNYASKPMKDEISIPINDLYPVSVVPYDFEPIHFEPKSVHVYQMNANDQFVDQFYDPLNEKEDNLELNSKDNQQVGIDQKHNQQDFQEDSKDNQDQGYNSSQHLSKNPTNLNDHNQIDKVSKKSFNETINKLNTLVSIKNDNQIKQKVLTSAEVENLDRNMNLLTQN